MAVSPSQVNLLVGESHVLRAVGKDGRIRHHVRWSITPGPAAKLTQNGDEAAVQAAEIASTVVLTADSDGDSARANLEILFRNSHPNGSISWSVAPLPGCKNTKITQAVPSTNGPDLYAQEDCPQGSVLRALNDDGRELWRRVFRGPDAPIADLIPSGPVQAPERLDPHNTSVCDRISAGMSRDDVVKLLAAGNLRPR